jgi:hypothetical protein
MSRPCLSRGATRIELCTELLTVLDVVHKSGDNYYMLHYATVSYACVLDENSSH